MALIKKAKRDNIFCKVLLSGTSGSGKSYSALRLATGMKKHIEKATKQEAKILFVDTEAGRGRYYASEFDYDYIELKELTRDDQDYIEYKKVLPKIDEPFAPENYNALIKYAVEEGYAIIIIDSITHEWTGKGGILEAKSRMPGTNDYVKWGTLTPRHDLFVYSQLHSPIHLISTVRSKADYAIEEENGKKTVRKVGLASITREGLDYEMTVTFNIDNKTHIAESDKDNTHIFDGRPAILTEDDGIKLMEWANSGIATAEDKKKYEEHRKEIEKAAIKDSGEFKDELKNAVGLLRKIKDQITDEQKDRVLSTAPDKNPNKIVTQEQAQSFINAVEELIKEINKGE